MSMLTLVAALVALFLVATWLSGAVVLGAWRVAWQRRGLRPLLGRLAPLAMLMPPVASLAFTLAAAVGGGCHCDVLGAVGVHLCFAHPGLSASLAPLAVMLLALFAARLAFHVPRLLRRVRAGLALERGSRVLTKVAAPIGNAFSLAFPRAQIVVDGAWWGELSLRERRIVLTHECAHLRRGDPFLLELLSLLALAMPRRLARSVLDGWREHAERQADAAAARAVAEVLDSLPATAEVVLDLRGNPGGYEDQARRIAELLLPPGSEAPGWRTRAGEIRGPGRQGRAAAPSVQILVDEETGSAAEHLAQDLLQGGAANLVGGPTVGKRSAQIPFLLPDGWTLLVTHTLEPITESCPITVLPPNTVALA